MRSEEESGFVEMRIVGVYGPRLSVGGETPQYVVVLETIDGERRLAVVVSESSARDIATQIEQSPPMARPMASQLLHEIISGLGATVKEIRIEKFVKRILFSTLVLSRLEGTKVVDARPSDVLPLALRTGVRLVASSDVLNQAGSTRASMQEGENAAYSDEVTEGARRIVEGARRQADKISEDHATPIVSLIDPWADPWA
jgi:bifunctional DNase/RNase